MIVDIALASGPKKIDRLRECKRFLSCVLYFHWRLPKLLFRLARCLTTGSVYFVFHRTNQLLLHFSIIVAGNYGSASRPNESFVGARAAKFGVGTGYCWKSSAVPGEYRQNEVR